jgi:serine/threonine protein kinase
MTGGTSRMTTAANFKEDRPTGNPFQAFYDVGELLGEGGYAKVYQCKRKSSQLTYAVKEITISKLEEYEDDQGDGDDGVLTLKDEITALRLRGGPYIILLFDVFESDPDTTYLVLEEMRAGGNDLLSRIMFVEKEVYTEREATQVCKIIFQAIDYCHKQHMAEHHHHVKPENLLLVSTSNYILLNLRGMWWRVGFCLSVLMIHLLLLFVVVVV